jgi:hypothetical protein
MTAIDWQKVEDELPALVKTLTGVPCQFRDQPRKMERGAVATLDILGQSSIGVDDKRWEDVGDPATDVQETVVGDREMTVQVSVWSPSQSLAKAARTHLNVLRTRLRWESAQKTLRGMGLALVRVEDVADATTPHERHLLVIVLVEVHVPVVNAIGAPERAAARRLERQLAGGLDDPVRVEQGAIRIGQIVQVLNQRRRTRANEPAVRIGP